MLACILQDEMANALIESETVIFESRMYLRIFKINKRNKLIKTRLTCLFCLISNVLIRTQRMLCVAFVSATFILSSMLIDLYA